MREDHECRGCAGRSVQTGLALAYILGHASTKESKVGFLRFVLPERHSGSTHEIAGKRC